MPVSGMPQGMASYGSPAAGSYPVTPMSMYTAAAGYAVMNPSPGGPWAFGFQFFRN
jgi:hypothetical protein